MACEYFRSPVGVLKICSDTESITEISISDGGESVGDTITAEAVRQLREYFNEERTEFNLPLKPNGSEFQKKVWNVLLNIPYGESLTYSEAAELAGNKKACRAVGNAVGRNPILIVIPCHRVKAKTGLGGFSAGIEVKKYLVKKENIKI
ncbi:MAG: methylated-DNA--[protein]-cysteine S-methyltransferase [Clostridia bacterium]|nr:methylated-DNA--[protein]-cysteine S-methyltransferase [Clostridia bacterium]